MKTLLAASTALLVAAAALPAAAQDYPVPKMFRSMAKEKGEWRVDFLEMEGKKAAKPMSMNICSDNLMKSSAERGAQKRESDCKHKLLKDTADEAVMEIACPKNTSTVSMKRESPNVVLMEMKGSGPKGPTGAKMRYTHTGPCKPGQAGISYDPNSEACQKSRAAAAKMDPAKQCASAGANRAQCEQMMRDQLAKLKAMCG